MIKPQNRIEKKLFYIINNISNIKYRGKLKNLLIEICRNSLKDIDENPSILYFYFAQAIQKRMGFSISKEIDEIIIKKITGINAGSVFFNKFQAIESVKQIVSFMLIEKTKDLMEITFCDFSSGKDSFILYIIQKLLNYNKKITKINYITVNTVRKEKDIFKNWDSNVEFKYIPINLKIELLKEEEWTLIKDNVIGSLICTAFFSFHHIVSSQNKTIHTSILGNIKKLKPLFFIVVEPDSDHINSDLNIRFKNSFTHFKSIFQLINNIENISPEENISLQCLFQKEIQDIIGNDEPEKERHEPAVNWHNKLKESGFKNNYIFSKIKLESIKSPDINIEDKHKYINIVFKDTSLLSIFSIN